MPQLVLEGTWEEITREARRLAGRRVRVTVLDAPEPATVPVPGQMSPQERIAALDALAEQYRHLPALPAEAFNRESLYEDHF